MADITVTGNESYFNEDAKFFKDVYIYGNLYYNFASFSDPIKFGDIDVQGHANFANDVYFEQNVSVGILTVRKRLDVGVGGTILTTSGGNIGIGITNPRQSLDINGNEIISGQIGIGSISPEQKLDVSGSVKISKDIYDSLNSPGNIGGFLTKDAQGIKWTDFTPSFSEGIFVYNEGTLIGVSSFRGLNFIAGGIATTGIRNYSSGLTVGIVTDSIQAFANSSNPNIADVYTFDIWELVPNSVNVYRNSKVGIKNSNPLYDLDVTGTTNITQTLDVAGATRLNLTLDVYSTTTLGSTLDVTGATSINSTLKVGSATTLGGTLTVGGAAAINSSLGVTGATTLGNILNVGGATTLGSTLGVAGATTLGNTLGVTGATTINNTLGVNGATSLNDTLSVSNSTTLSSTLGVTGATTLSSTLNVGGATSISGATSLNSTLQVGVGGTVITTTGIGSVGIGTNTPIKDIDLAKAVLLRKALYDNNRNVGYDTNFYQVPRAVLTQVGVGTTGEIIGGRFFDAANMIRLNLDFIANEAIGFLTSTDYKNPAFVVPGVGGVSTCRSDIKKILKAITLDITKGGNSQSVGAGLSYYNGPSLIHITGNDTNGYSIKDATIVAITSAAQIARYVINNVSLPKSYQNGVSSIRQIKDLTLQNDAAVGFNTSLSGCSNVVSAITVCAGIVTTIIGGGPSASPNITYPDGKVIWAPAGADSRNLIWVSKYGNDDNTGSTEGDAKLTIAAACEIAQPGDTVMVRSGVYYENNPIGLRTDVSVSGQDLRLVTIVPKNLAKDVFHVRRGCLIENMNFACDTGQSNPGGGALAFPPTTTDIASGKSYGAVSGYTAPGPATEGTSGRWRSPYVRNCTNFMPLSIGMKIDGNHATASTIGADLKCMVCDSFTQYNEAGIGVSITNNGYAQLVSIFTINCDKAIYVDSGGQCDLTNSNSSFGNYGLYAVGLGATEFTAKVNTTTTAESDVIVFKDVKDSSLNIRRPYDGQALFFKINLSNYNTGQTGIITAPMQRLKRIDIINGGSGYSSVAPPDITIYDSNTNGTDPLGPEGIVAELSPTISDAGAITAVDLVNSGRNYLSSQNIKVRINGVATNDLSAVMEPIYYTVGAATSTSPSGISTVTLNEFVPYLVYADDAIEMKRISRILTSGHSFEYIGSGTDINTSTPLKGAVPNKDNEVVALDGAQIPYTSTDQKGNFNIGEGIQVNQTTATISGRDFSKAIQAQVTPLILALR